MSLVPPLSRREFLATATLSAAALAHAEAIERAAAPVATPPSTASAQPWYRRTYRWGQTNLTEIDPRDCDISWWRQYWKRTLVQGVIINAGGIVAYYPSKFPLQYRAAFLGDRDLYGDLARAAHEDGLTVLARMDSNRAHEEMYRAHPDWFARDAGGGPYKSGDRFITCINSPYYDEWLPGILREIIDRSHPEGFTDNSWGGLGRASICYCANCTRKFRERTGKSLPVEKNWDNPVYRQWIEWNYARRVEIWDANNVVTKAAGGPDCLWVGMNSGSVSEQAQSFRPLKEICDRAEIILLDHQARSDNAGFQQNGETGKLLHSLLGWDKLLPESMALYQAGHPTFRKASKPEPEARLWILEGFAGGIQPWWHHVGAHQEDRRQFNTIEPLNRWHQQNEQFLTQRRPLASIGVAWTQKNVDFFGRDHAAELVELPWRGITQALMQARIPYVPVHLDHLDRGGAELAALVLPNLAAVSDAHAAAIRRYVQQGGGLLATGETSALDEWGDPRPDFALNDLFGAHVPAGRAPLTEAVRARRASETLHTYLRLPPAAEPRHPVLRGFEDTDILAFGGALEALSVTAGSEVPLTFVPPFPIYPPETAWMREPSTKIPGLILNQAHDQGRVAFLPADLDRRFGRDNLPDHAQLLANLVRWVGRDNIPLSVSGAGLVDCHLYRQPQRLILHLVNLTNAGTWRQPVYELIPIGPLQVYLRAPKDLALTEAKSLTSDKSFRIKPRDGWFGFDVRSILDHEVIVFS